MKRYIKASFDASIPDWLKADKRAIQALNAAGIDLQTCVFSKERTGKVGDNYTIYLVEGTKWGDKYRPFVWIPGVYNDDEYVDAEPQYSYRYGQSIKRPQSSAVKYMPKKNLKLADTVYVYIDSNKKPVRDRYQDPRYDSEGNYAGQYFIPEQTDAWNRETKPAHWSENGKTTYTGGRYGKHQKRDKSGYVIPDPKERLRKFHESEEGRTRQGEKAKKQLEYIYSQLVTLRDDILADLNNAPVETFGSKYKALDYFNDALDYYKRALNTLDASKHYGWIDTEGALDDAERAQDRLDTSKKILSGERTW